MLADDLYLNVKTKIFRLISRSNHCLRSRGSPSKKSVLFGRRLHHEEAGPRQRKKVSVLKLSKNILFKIKFTDRMKLIKTFYQYQKFPFLNQFLFVIDKNRNDLFMPFTNIKHFKIIKSTLSRISRPLILL